MPKQKKQNKRFQVECQKKKNNKQKELNSTQHSFTTCLLSNLSFRQPKGFKIFSFLNKNQKPLSSFRSSSSHIFGTSSTQQITKNNSITKKAEKNTLLKNTTIFLGTPWICFFRFCHSLNRISKGVVFVFGYLQQDIYMSVCYVIHH